MNRIYVLNNIAEEGGRSMNLSRVTHLKVERVPPPTTGKALIRLYDSQRMPFAADDGVVFAEALRV